VNVSAIIVTRGDVDLIPIIESLPDTWERIIWDNGAREIRFHLRGAYAVFCGNEYTGRVPDLAVYGRYAALTDRWLAARSLDPGTGEELAQLVYVQDDDVVLHDPAALVDEWYESEAIISAEHGDQRDFVVCNMPTAFREQPFYASGEHALVGFGAVFHRSAPARAFEILSWYLARAELAQVIQDTAPQATETIDVTDIADLDSLELWPELARTCDIVFTALTPRVLVDVPYENLPWADAPNRMWKQPGHQEERQRMFELVRQVRDAEGVVA
jgi:hypothetical protein